MRPDFTETPLELKYKTRTLLGTGLFSLTALSVNMTSPSFAGLRTNDLMYQAAAAGYEGLLGQVTRAGCGNTWSSKPGRENLDFFSGNVNLLGRARAKGDSVSNLISRRIL